MVLVMVLCVAVSCKTDAKSVSGGTNCTTCILETCCDPFGLCCAGMRAPRLYGSLALEVGVSVDGSTCTHRHLLQHQLDVLSRHLLRGQ